MYHTYFFLKRLAKELHQKLVGAELVVCFSQSKDELILGYAASEYDFYIKAHLQSKTGLLHFSDSFQRARKNSVDLFPEVIGHKVLEVRVFENERSFKMTFTNGSALIFKMHGSRSNILLANFNQVHSIFRGSLGNDLSIKPDELNRKDPDYEIFEKEKLRAFPHLGKEVKEYFFAHEEPDEKLWARIHQVIGQLSHSPIYIYQEPHSAPHLRLFDTGNSFVLKTESALEASNFLFEKSIRYLDFEEGKHKLIQVIQADIKRSESYISKNELKLKELKEGRSYTELANLMMANLHSFKDGVKELEVVDFYTGSPIKLRLKQGQTPQSQAESLYRKGKNQFKEISTLEENIRKKREDLGQLICKLTSVTNEENPKVLKTMGQKQKVEKNADPLPYHSFTFKNYEILIGKNATSNDHLTQRIATKNDLWLHARDTPGSHVIVRQKPGSNFPTDVIEKAAQLAAWNSKRKTDSLCPVIYTEKKYVRKVKGARPGEVQVDREKVIMVVPAPV